MSGAVRPVEKDEMKMPTQKTFKRRVRARMAKTGEAYSAARAQLLRRSDTRTSATKPPASIETPPVELPVTDDAIRKGTGRSWPEWFALLDEWDATARRHPEIARWLREEHEVDGWWAQSITVGYERARGMRGKHEQATGFSVSATKTVGVDPGKALRAFTDARRRRRWLPDAPMRQRPTRAANAARFDWADPPSIVVVTVAAKGADRATVAIQHERVADAATAEELKLAWRARLADLKDFLEAG